MVLDSKGKEIKLPANISGEDASYSTSENVMGYTNGQGEFVSLNQRIGVYLFGDEIERITEIDVLTGERKGVLTPS